MIVDVTGFGWSGSGAFHDLLREYDDVQFASYEYDFEFTLLWVCDGIADLEHKLCEKHCRFFDSNKAIHRFIEATRAMNNVPMMQYNRVFHGRFPSICKRYIDDLTDVVFEGHSFDDLMYPTPKDRILYRYNYLIKKILGNHYLINLFHRDFSKKFIYDIKFPIYVSYNPELFLSRTHQLMDELFSYVRKDENKPIITDQFFPTENPEKYFKYVNEPAKAIVVRRDPRDTFLLTKVTYNSGIHYPVDNIDDFIVYYKKIVESSKKIDVDSVLYVNFEELVYDYSNTKNKIEQFIGLSNHTKPRRYFNPDVSINNTQLYKKYNGFEQEIRQIEDALPESLFDFSKYPDMGPNINNRTF